MKWKKIPRKNNLVIVEKILRFIRGLTAEDTNSQIHMYLKVELIYVPSK